MVLIVVIQIVHAKIVLVKTVLADNSSKAIAYFVTHKKNAAVLFLVSFYAFSVAGIAVKAD